LTVWALALAISFNQYPLGILAWFSLVRPLWIISRQDACRAFSSAYLFAFMFNLFSLYWVAMVTPPGMIAAVIIVAFYYAAALMVFWKLFRIRPLWGCIAAPLVWVGVEYFRTLSEFAFPWSDLGYSQAYFLYIIQFVSIVSVHGLSLIIVAVNVLIWQIFRKEAKDERRLTAGFVAVGIVALMICLGWAMVPKYPLPGEYTVGLLQGSVPLEVKWAEGNQRHSFQLYDSLARDLQDGEIKLFVWPETSAPCYLSHDVPARRAIGATAQRTNAFHLVGALGAEVTPEKTRTFNSCYEFAPDGQMVERYNKVKLVPFSEHVPYQDYLPFLQKNFLKQYLTFIDQAGGVQWWSDFYPGDSARLFETDRVNYGVLICFETAFPEFVRGIVRNGADFVVGITNDTWFGTSVGIYQHARIFITRAIENRCWMARSANSGLTFVVDPYGRIREQLGTYEVAGLKVRVGLIDSWSLYTEYGDVAGRVSFFFTLSAAAIMVALWLLRKLSKRFS